jgi:regulator of replication initiation timing
MDDNKSNVKSIQSFLNEFEDKIFKNDVLKITLINSFSKSDGVNIISNIIKDIDALFTEKKNNVINDNTENIICSKKILKNNKVLNESNEALLKQIQDVEDKLNIETQLTKSLRDLLSKQNQKNEEDKEDENKFEKINKKLEERIIELESINNTLRVENNTQKDEINENKDNISELKISNKNLMEKIKELDIKINFYVSQNSIINHYLSATNRRNDELNIQVEKLKLQLIDKNSNKEGNVNNIQFKQEKGKFEEEKAKFEEEKNKFEKEKKKFETEKEEYNTNIQNIDMSIIQANQEIDKLKSLQDSITSENEKLTQENTRLKHELENLQLNKNYNKNNLKNVMHIESDSINDFKFFVIFDIFDKIIDVRKCIDFLNEKSKFNIHYILSRYIFGINIFYLQKFDFYIIFSLAINFNKDEIQVIEKMIKNQFEIEPIMLSNNTKREPFVSYLNINDVVNTLSESKKYLFERLSKYFIEYYKIKKFILNKEK